MGVDNFISLRYLFSKRSERFISFISVISILGIILGVATLIIVINVMIGFEDNLKNKILGINAHIVVNRIDKSSVSDWQPILKKIKKIDGVEAASPFLMNQVLISSSRGSTGAVVKAVEPSLEKNVIDLEKFIVDGRLINEEAESYEILLGRELALKLGAFVGDNITIISPMGSKGPFGYVPLLKRFRVVGIFDCGIYDYNASFSFISLKSAQEFFKTGNVVDAFGVRAENFDMAKDVASKIQEVLSVPFVARDWLSMNKSLFSALKLEKIAMFLILILIVIVASFNIVSLITITVKDKEKDIAMLRSVGASESLIRKIFIKQGLLIGVIGTVIGNILAFLVSFILERYKIISL
ncbi:MAG: ABC transporter permease, partial [Deferribacterota bacterium]|nr:ABC transporter permease [Deferribacterota bacterium]